MNARDARRGGLEVWAPSVVPPIGLDLSSEQALAVADRPQSGRGGLSRRVDRAGLQTGLRRDAHRKEPVLMKWADMAGMQRSLIERAADVYWAGAARMTIKTDPAVLN
jgi:hypothetical protein